MYVLLAFACIGIVFGILGALVMCCKNSRCYAFVLTPCLFLTWMLVLIIGITFAGVAKHGKTLVGEVCLEVASGDVVTVDATTGETTVKEDSKIGAIMAGATEQGKEILKEAAEYLNSNELNTYLCSRFCPCPALDDVRNQWLELTVTDVMDAGRVGAIKIDGKDNPAPEPWVFGGLTYAVGSTVGVVDPLIYPKEFTSF